MLPEQRIIRDQARSRALAHRVHPRAALPGGVTVLAKHGSRAQTPSLVSLKTATKSDKFQHDSLMHAVKEGLSIAKELESEETIVSDVQPADSEGPDVQRDSIQKGSAEPGHGHGQLSLFDVAVLKQAKPKPVDELTEYEVISKPSVLTLDESTTLEERMDEWEKVENEWKESVKLERTYAQVVTAA